MALSLRLPLLGVTQRPALWSPDFPQTDHRLRLPGLLTQYNITRPVEGVKAYLTLDIHKYRLIKSTSDMLIMSTGTIWRVFPFRANKSQPARNYRKHPLQ